jgi:hypothetical protein
MGINPLPEFIPAGEQPTPCGLGRITAPNHFHGVREVFKRVGIDHPNPFADACLPAIRRKAGEEKQPRHQRAGAAPVGILRWSGPAFRQRRVTIALRRG